MRFYVVPLASRRVFCAGNIQESGDNVKCVSWIFDNFTLLLNPILPTDNERSRYATFVGIEFGQSKWCVNLD